MNGSDNQSKFRVNVPVALVLVAVAVVVLGGAAWAYARSAPNVDVVGLELAGTVAEAQRLVGDDAAGFADAIRADFLLIGGYVVALLMLGLLGRGVFWTPGAQQMAARSMAGAVAAGALDLAENILLLDFLNPPTVLDDDFTLRLVQATAFTKFTLLAVTAIIAVVATGVTLSRLGLQLWARLRRTPRQPLVREHDVLAPVEPSPSDADRPTTRWDSASRVPPGRPPAEVGIPASGGGIRSACVTLGALQSLRDHEELQRAGYLVSVPGGGVHGRRLATRPATGPALARAAAQGNQCSKPRGCFRGPRPVEWWK